MERENRLIDGEYYKYVRNAMMNPQERDSYMELAQMIFKLDFFPWYQSGYMDDCFLPHTFYHNGLAAASVGIYSGKFKWRGIERKFGQLSTVMTHPEYRGKGLNRWLLEAVLKECEDYDLLYLYANDTVCGYYPRFGFEKTQEFTYRKQIINIDGEYRKLNLKHTADCIVLADKYRSSNNPFSALTVERSLSLLMFHCFTYLRDNLYYIEQYDTVVIAEAAAEKFICYDIYTNEQQNLDVIIGMIAPKNAEYVRLGFTPIDKSGFIVTPANEKNTTVFTLPAQVNPFAEDRVTFPLLSRA